jgi:putative peptidoglycan lipid II flippase
MIASSRAAIADHGRRRHRVVIAVGGVVAVFRQPPDRTAARHCRRRHGHRAGAGTDARRARRRQGSACACESRALELAVGLALPATLGLIVLSEPIVRMLFEHGAFTAADTAATAQALMWLALGLPAHVLVKALSPAFFARERHADAAARDAEGICGRDRAGRRARSNSSAPAASPPPSRWGPGATRWRLIRRGAATFGFSIDAAARRRLPRIVAAALAMGGLLVARDRLHAVAAGGSAHGLAQAASCWHS